MAVGGVAGAALVEPLRHRLGERRVLALDVVGTILLIGTPALTTNPFAIGAAMLVGGAGSAVWRVICAVLRQRLTPAELIGRVSSAGRAISWGVLPLGAALGGTIAELWSVRAVFVVGGVASLGLLVLFGLAVRPADLAAATAPHGGPVDVGRGVVIGDQVTTPRPRSMEEGSVQVGAADPEQAEHAGQHDPQHR